MPGHFECGEPSASLIVVLDLTGWKDSSCEFTGVIHSNLVVISHSGHLVPRDGTEHCRGKSSGMTKQLYNRGHELLSSFPDVKDEATSLIVGADEVVVLCWVDVHGLRTDPVKHLVLLNHLGAVDPCIHHSNYPSGALADQEGGGTHLAVVGGVSHTIFISYNKACSCFSTSSPRSVPSYEVEMRRLGLNLSQVRELTGLLCGFQSWTPLLAPSKSLTSHKPMPPSLPPAAARTLSSMGWMATEKILSLTTLATRSSLIVMLESLFRHSSSSPPKLAPLEVFSILMEDKILSRYSDDSSAVPLHVSLHPRVSNGKPVS